MPWNLLTVVANIKRSLGFMTPADKLYNAALLYIGTDASPMDMAADHVACMETVDTIYKKVFGHYIRALGDKPTLSTETGIKILRNSPSRFKEIKAPVRGCLVISPTGSPDTVGSGHIGIAGDHQIMSNDSRPEFLGLWEANYTLENWPRLFAKRGFPTYYFLPL